MLTTPSSEHPTFRVPSGGSHEYIQNDRSESYQYITVHVFKQAFCHRQCMTGRHEAAEEGVAARGILSPSSEPKKLEVPRVQICFTSPLRNVMLLSHCKSDATLNSLGSRSLFDRTE
jgi:hypothetical protein